MRTREGPSPPRQAASRPRAGPDPPAQPRGDADDGLDGLEDALLVPRAREGDDDAFAVLVHRHSTPMLALAYQMLGNPADAEEAVQDAFVSGWRRLPGFRGEAAFGTWMYRIVTNRCLNILRGHTPSAPLEAVPEPVSRDVCGEPARATESAAATAALAEALRGLRPDQCACWVLRELHGLSYEDIAQAVGASEQTVRGRLFRARHTLMKEMASWR